MIARALAHQRWTRGQKMRHASNASIFLEKDTLLHIHKRRQKTSRSRAIHLNRSRHGAIERAFGAARALRGKSAENIGRMKEGVRLHSIKKRPTPRQRPALRIKRRQKPNRPSQIHHVCPQDPEKPRQLNAGTVKRQPAKQYLQSCRENINANGQDLRPRDRMMWSPLRLPPSPPIQRSP